MSPKCPLCGAPELGPSWMGSTFYDGVEFRYLQCPACGSLSCDPMPGSSTLDKMYGPGYSTMFGGDASIPDPKDPARTVSWLSRLDRGTFIDYGCGSGAMLKEAARLCWRATGVEFNPEVALSVERRIGVRVVSDPSRLLDGGSPPADLLHLGDVIEHLTSPADQVRGILGLLKPGGILLAQGPLEAGPNFFTSALKLARRARRQRRYEMAPYHTMLATVEGQRQFFRRLGLEELEYRVSEEPWPAPGLSPRSASLRLHSLFFLRRCSQWITRLHPEQWGNRYYYAGRLGEPQSRVAKDDPPTAPIP